MSVNINNIQKDRTVFLGFIITLVGTIVSFVFLIFSYKNLPAFVPLFNQLPWGADRLIGKEGLFILYIISLVFFLCNIFFSAAVYERMPLIARMVTITSVFVSFSVSYFLIRTIFLVI